MTLNRIEKSLKEQISISDFYRSYQQTVSELLEKVPTQILEEVGYVFKEAHQNSRNIFIIGNGGSAATANHFATDLMLGPTKYGKTGFKAHSLCTNNSINTAISNDNGFDEIFTRQLKALANEDDILFIISASGNSKNLLNTIELCQEKKIRTIALLGFNGGALKDKVRHPIYIPSEDKDYGPIEDVHSILQHCLANWLISQI